MATIAERILEAIRYAPLDDDVLAKRLGVSQRQSINQVARRLESQHRLKRYVGRDGKIVNALADGPLSNEPEEPPAIQRGDGTRITEDEVKLAVRDHLAGQGYDVTVAWGRTRGIDIDARHPGGRRIIIEAKAEVGTSGPQQVNYFLGMLGELVQRMDDDQAEYGIALPRNRQYEGLVERLPRLAKDRLRLVVFWVTRDGDAFAIDVQRAGE